MNISATLDELIESVQLEVGHSTSISVGVNFREHIAGCIRKEYRRLHAEFDWPHLLAWHTKNIAAGDREVALPVGVELARVVHIYHRLTNGTWHPLRRDMTVEDLNEVDSDANARRDPVAKWRSLPGDIIEIWPRPTSAGQLRFVAKSKRLALLDGEDVCDIDEDVVVLFAAAVLLFRAGNDSAGMTLQRARNAYDTLRQRLQTGANRLSLLG